MQALYRYGAILIRPRETAAALDPDEGIRDGLWLGVLFVLGGHVYPLMEAVATAWAVRNYSGALMLGAALGRSLVAPILVLVACETILGPGRGYRRGICLVPLVLVSVAAHLLVRVGVPVPGPTWGPAVVGGVASLALALWIRPSVPALDEEGP